MQYAISVLNVATVQQLVKHFCFRLAINVDLRDGVDDADKKRNHYFPSSNIVLLRNPPRYS